MGFRFRRSIRLGKGLRINLSKSGASLSVGRRGATMNLSPKGNKITVGLPGTGLSYSTRIGESRVNQAHPVDIATHDRSTLPKRPPSGIGRLLGWGLVVFVVAVACMASFAVAGHN